MKISVNGGTINYVDHGSPQGLPIVFIHGFPFSHEMWKSQIQALPNTYRALAYDVRGHGLSDVGDGQYTIELFVDDLIALLDHLVLKKVVLCGLSIGGYIALRTVERYPDRIKGLILCDTKSDPDSHDAKVKRTTTMKTVKTSGVHVFAEEFVKSIFCKKTFDHHPDTIECIKQIIFRNSSLGICGTLLALASRTDTTPMLSSINVPTCIIIGEHDTLTPPSGAQTMHNAIAGSEFHILADAGHMSNMENPEGFNRRVLAFLKTLDS